MKVYIYDANEDSWHFLTRANPDDLFGLVQAVRDYGWDGDATFDECGFAVHPSGFACFQIAVTE